MDAEQTAFSAIIKREKGIIHKICNLYCDTAADRADLFQEIVIQIWKSYKAFRGESKFSTWVYRVALNTALTHLKKEKRRPDNRRLDDRQFEIRDAAYDPQVEENVKQLYKAIKKLPHVDRALIFLYLEDKSYKEIAETLGITATHARVKMNRAKQKIKRIIGI